LNKKTALGVPLVLSTLMLSACSGSKDAAVAPGATVQPGAPSAQAPVVREMQPLQPGQPPQKPDKTMFAPKVPVVQGGQPGTTPLTFGQPFKLGDLEYQFIVARGGKAFVGLESSPALKPTAGNTYFLVRYQVTDHGQSVTIPNSAAVHMLDLTSKQVTDVDQAATNADVQSGAATGMPDQLSLDPEQPQIQTLAFQLPTSTDLGKFALLVTEPKDPTHVFQIVKLSN